MLIIIPAILLLGFIIWAVTRPYSGDSSEYSKTKNYMDFDAGKDAAKIGDPKYPTSGADSVLKQEFLNDLMDDK